LTRSEFNRDRLGFPRRELSDVSTSRSIDHRTEGVQFLDPSGELNSIAIVQGIPLKSIKRIPKSWRLLKEQPAPGGLRRIFQRGARFLAPIRAGESTVLHCGVDVSVRLGHLLEASVVDDEVGPKDTKQGE